MKRPAFGRLQGVIVGPEAFSSVVPLHAIRFGKLLTIVTVPGEPTTEVGRMIAGHVKAITDTDEVVVAAHGDDYIGYVATAPEYSLQYYEGSSTFFGNNEPYFFDEQLSNLASELSSHTSHFLSERRFQPGHVHHFMGNGPCDAKHWRPLDTRVEHDHAGRLAVTFTWQGLREGHVCEELPSVGIECDGVPLRNDKGRPEDDDWLNFEVRRDRHSHWSATWRPDSAPLPALRCHVLVERPLLPPLVSAEFTTD